MVKPALEYLDKKIQEDYEAHLRRKSAGAGELGYLQIQYLYMRSFFMDLPVPGPVFGALNYYRKLSQQNWLAQNKYMQGMIALSLYRTGDAIKAKDILSSRQTAVNNEELGMYWKENLGGLYWQQAPIETPPC